MQIRSCFSSPYGFSASLFILILVEIDILLVWHFYKRIKGKFVYNLISISSNELMPRSGDFFLDSFLFRTNVTLFDLQSDR